MDNLLHFCQKYTENQRAENHYDDAKDALRSVVRCNVAEADGGDDGGDKVE